MYKFFNIIVITFPLFNRFACKQNTRKVPWLKTGAEQTANSNMSQNTSLTPAGRG
jgi:hypothetical protein